ARTHEGDLCGGDAREAAGEAADDFIRELVREFADLRISGRAAVNLANNGLRGSAADVIDPAGEYNFTGGFREIAEGDEIGVDLGGDPVAIVQLGRQRGHLDRIEARADKIDDSRELQVIADDLGKELRVGFGIVIARCEIGNGYARLFYA